MFVAHLSLGRPSRKCLRCWSGLVSIRIVLEKGSDFVQETQLFVARSSSEPSAAFFFTVYNLFWSKNHSDIISLLETNY